MCIIDSSLSIYPPCKKNYRKIQISWIKNSTLLKKESRKTKQSMMNLNPAILKMKTRLKDSMRAL
jgi:hypothetical protein